MVLAPSIGAALYTNVLQERQQHYVTRHAQNVDMLHPEASASFTQTLQGMQYQGKSKQEAINKMCIRDSLLFLHQCSHIVEAVYIVLT